MNRGARALGALAGGIGLGVILRASGSAALLGAAHSLQPLGTLWLNALKMTLVPLVFGTVAHGVFRLDRSGGGARLLGLALPLFAALLAGAMAIGIAFGAALVRLWPVAPGLLGPLAAAPPTAVRDAPGLAALLTSLIPSNPIAAAASGAMASIVLFAILFGFAVSRADGAGSEAVANVLSGLAHAMMRMVEWVLWFGTAGIFILSLGLALNAGVAMAGFIVEIMAGMAGAALLAFVMSYLLAWGIGAIAPIRFGRAILGAQVLAAGTCSSAAALPVMMEESAGKLALPETVSGAVLPLAISIFRLGSTASGGAMLVLMLHATGTAVDPLRMAIGAGLLILSGMSAAGLPGAAIIYANLAAGFSFVGISMGVIPLLIAANALPDLMITIANVTADLAVTAAIARLLGRQGSRASVAAMAPAEALR